MKIKNEFILREIAGSWIVVPVGQRIVEFNGLISLNESGAQLWRKLMSDTNEQELVNWIVKEYEIEEYNARADVREFITFIQEKGLVE